MWIVFGMILAFMILVIVVMEVFAKKDDDFSDYATGGRSFNSLFGTTAFINTWLPGTVFISFAGLTAGSGVVGFYLVQYSVLASIIMYLLARPVYLWGKRYDLRTQADLIRLRYGSQNVQVIAAVIGIIASVPWVVLGMQSLALIFSFSSDGSIGPVVAVLLGVVLLTIRQIWTVRFGMRGVMISDLVQGIFAYLIGTIIIFGIIFWLIANGHGFAQIDPEMLYLPGPGSDLGPLYLFSLVLTGALGGWCWPDIFVRLFTQNGVRTIRKTAMQAMPTLLVFATALNVMALLASSVPEVQAAPDTVWFLVTSVGGPFLLGLAAICVLGASMGNVGANLQAIGATVANDVIGPIQGKKVNNANIGRLAVGAVTIASSAGAMLTAAADSGLIVLAQVSYQGVCQLAPALFLGIFWRRATALGASLGMLSGFCTAAAVQLIYPLSVPWLGGLTSGVVGLAVNVTVMVSLAYLTPNSGAEQVRVDSLFNELKTTKGPVR
ncbi:sodium:solute symporter family protein [Nesterenkonia aerolata]|uniref:Sodium:solute symporter family protein n=1 Tax=Nesterenkonia aerolata TaxID=3074079 RepID=A0ABU2DPK5_9MICC|nr:sodium:solute symporter family protein [Nesterenkonia sp. LY-0111]MDR8018447.1 sodium:solute symporter family protein [Nesterenkonia sp. LY-0111]